MNSNFTLLVSALFIGLIVVSALGIYQGNQVGGQDTAKNLAIAATVLSSVLFVMLIWYYQNYECYKSPK